MSGESRERVLVRQYLGISTKRICFANGTAMSGHCTNLADDSNEYQLLIYYHIFASHELIDVNDENYAIHNENHNSYNFYNTINI